MMRHYICLLFYLGIGTVGMPCSNGHVIVLTIQLRGFFWVIINWSTHLRQAIRDSLANNVADGGSLSAHLLFVNLCLSELSCNKVIELLFLGDKLVRVLFCLIPRSVLIT